MLRAQNPCKLKHIVCNIKNMHHLNIIHIYINVTKFSTKRRATRDLRAFKSSDESIRRISRVSNTVLSLHTALPVLRSAPRTLPLPTDLLYTALFTTKKNTNFPNSRSALSLADLRWPTGSILIADYRVPRSKPTRRQNKCMQLT